MNDNPAPLGLLKNGYPRGDPSNAPRCGAKTRAGSPCQQPAMTNGRCRLHGGKSPGAPRGDRNGNYRHGLRTKEAIADRHRAVQLRKRLHQFAESLLSPAGKKPRGTSSGFKST